MSPTLRVVLRLALLAALLAVPSAAPAEEDNPLGLGSPNLSDNPNIDHNLYGGGDAGSPWPVSIRDPHRRGPVTQSVPSGPAAVPWPEPVLVLLPGSLPRVVWLPLPVGPVVTGEGPLPTGHGGPPAS
jgi:hypothetical protein